MVIVTSYNSHGLNNVKQAYINKLFIYSEFVFLQEHRLRNDDMSSLVNINDKLSHHCCLAC